MKGYRYEHSSREWIRRKKLPKESMAWLSTVKGKEKHALKHWIISEIAR